MELNQQIQARQSIARGQVVPMPWRARLSSSLVPYLFILPKFIVFFAFTLVPLVWAVGMTFQSGTILRGLHYTGFDNYSKIGSDGQFWDALGHSVYYSVLVIPIVLVTGLFLATLLNRLTRFRSLFTVLLLVPSVTSVVAASVIWGALLNTRNGLFNTVLVALGLQPVNWLGTPGLIIPLFVVLEAWRGSGFYTVLFLAAMRSIPKHLYDAAAIDGATGVQAFRLVTLPLLRPTLLFASVMATIWNLQIFDPPFVLTKGGPGYASTTIVMYIYNTAFKYNNVGFAATMSFTLLIIIMILSVVQLSLFRKEVQY